MSSMNMNNVIWVSSAVVAGILGAAGFYLISHIATQHSHVKDDSEALRNQVDLLQKEIDTLRQLQKQNAQKKKRNRQKGNFSVSAVSETDTADYRSVIDTDFESDDEFFDVSDTDEDVTLTEEVDSSELLGSIKSAIQECDELLSSPSDGNVKDAYEKLSLLKNNNKSYTDYQLSEILWRLCRCCQRLVNICEQNDDNDRKKIIIDEGVEYGEEALRRDSSNYSVHKWYAIMIGMKSKALGPSERIKIGNTYFHHIQEALKLKPTDPTLHHLIGRFKYELASLSWFEKRAASALFGNLPEFNFDDALSDFMKAEDLVDFKWKENKLYVAKCYIGKKMNGEGAEWLNTTLEINNRVSDDYIVDKEAKELLKKYNT